MEKQNNSVQKTGWITKLKNKRKSGGDTDDNIETQRTKIEPNVKKVKMNCDESIMDLDELTDSYFDFIAEAAASQTVSDADVDVDVDVDADVDVDVDVDVDADADVDVEDMDLLDDSVISTEAANFLSQNSVTKPHTKQESRSSVTNPPTLKVTAPPQKVNTTAQNVKKVATLPQLNNKSNTFKPKQPKTPLVSTSSTSIRSSSTTSTPTIRPRSLSNPPSSSTSTSSSSSNSSRSKVSTPTLTTPKQEIKSFPQKVFTPSTTPAPYSPPSSRSKTSSSSTTTFTTPSPVKQEAQSSLTPSFPSTSRSKTSTHLPSLVKREISPSSSRYKTSTSTVTTPSSVKQEQIKASSIKKTTLDNKNATAATTPTAKKLPANHPAKITPPSSSKNQVTPFTLAAGIKPKFIPPNCDDILDSESKYTQFLSLLSSFSSSPPSSPSTSSSNTKKEKSNLIQFALVYKFGNTSFRFKTSNSKGDDDALYIENSISGIVFYPENAKKPLYLSLTPTLSSNPNKGPSKEGEYSITIEEKKKVVMDMFLQNPDIKKMSFNWQENFRTLLYLFNCPECEPVNIVDTKTNAWILDTELSSYDFDTILFRFSITRYKSSNSNNIKSNSKHSKTTNTDNSNSLFSSLKDSSSNYDHLSSDCIYNFKLFIELENEISKFPKMKHALLTQEIPVTHICAKMEYGGIYFSSESLPNFGHLLEQTCNSITREIQNTFNFSCNLSSPNDVKLLCQKFLKLTPMPMSTSSDALEPFKGDPWVDKIMFYRKCQKLLTTYIRPLSGFVNSKKDNKIHAFWIPYGTSTGRLSSSCPNLQNLPAESLTIPGMIGNGSNSFDETKLNLRSCIVPPNEDSVLIKCDYSQMELKILAHYSKDVKMINIFQNGKDIHRIVASEIFGKKEEEISKAERESVKWIVYGICYGMGHSKTNQDEAAKMAKFLQNFSGISRWIEKTKEEMRKSKCVWTIKGRRRKLEEEGENRRERQAVNTVIQGSAADVVKEGMVRMERKIKEKQWANGVRLVMNVHDELVYECRKEWKEEFSRELKKVMESCVELEVKLTVKLYEGINYGNMIEMDSINNEVLVELLSEEEKEQEEEEEEEFVIADFF